MTLAWRFVSRSHAPKSNILVLFMNIISKHVILPEIKNKKMYNV